MESESLDSDSMNPPDPFAATLAADYLEYFDTPKPELAERLREILVEVRALRLALTR